MKVDMWGFPVIDWGLAPKAKRRVLNDFKPEDLVDYAFLGLPEILGYGNTAAGEKFLISPSGTLYTFEDFEHAAGMTFSAHMRIVGVAVSESLSRVLALATRDLRRFAITYTTKGDPFSFKEKIVSAADLMAAVGYGNHHLVRKGHTVIGVQEKD